MDLLRNAFFVKPRPSLSLEFRVDRFDAIQVVAGRLLQESPGVVVFKLRGQKTESGSDSGVQWHDHVVDPQQSCHVDGVHGARAAISHQSEVFGVMAPFNADIPDRANHRIVGDLENPVGGGILVQA